MLKKFFLSLALAACLAAEATLPEIDAQGVRLKFDEVMQAHAEHKTLTPALVKTALRNFLEELDPTKTYFIKAEIEQWTDPSDELAAKILAAYHEGRFPEFEQIFAVMEQAIGRRNRLEDRIDLEKLPEEVDQSEFKDLDFVDDEEALVERIKKLRGLQLEAAKKLDDEVVEKTLQRIDKRRRHYEEEFLSKEPLKRERLLFSKILKALAASLDSHTNYFTPDEAEQFMINVQQRLSGIGAQLRDDLNGFTLVKILEGGAADRSGELKEGDRIIAVNGEPVVGMDIIDAVSLIRGEENTPVVLTIVREEKEEKGTKESTLDVTVVRSEVVIKEARYESSIEPFADGVILHLKLHTFYQDEESSSAQDLAEEFESAKKEHHILGVVLDLRYNSGGLLSQAVSVAGLFIKKGIVVSIKDEQGELQHLRDLNSQVMWGGPLIVLINRASASASEIVAQTLQDYGKALVVGDEQSYGKGSFQTFTLNTQSGRVNPQGEYKVTRGRYYTVSGASPQLVGVSSDVVVPGPLSEQEIGEKFSKNPLQSDRIEPNFEDNLTDIPEYRRPKILTLYKFNLQKRSHLYEPYLPILERNSKLRIEQNKNYQAFLKEIQEEKRGGNPADFGQNDLQLAETYQIMKDLLMMLKGTL